MSSGPGKASGTCIEHILLSTTSIATSTGLQIKKDQGRMVKKVERELS